MSEGQVGGGVSSITDLRALRTRILGKAKVARPVTNAEALVETLKGIDFAEQVKLAVPGGVEFDVGRFVQSVLRALEEDERLLACDPKSVLGAALRCAEIGLMVGGVMQHAFMVPRARRDGRGGFMYEAELSIGYRGMIALAMRSGRVKSVTSRVVTDREIEEGRFDLYYEGDKDVMIHRPVLYGEKGEAVMVYCLVRFVDGTFHVEPMSKDEIERIKEQAVQRWNGADGESPWITAEMEMWRKSPVRRAFKYLNVQVEGLDRAVSLEEERERGQRQDLARLIDAAAASDLQDGGASMGGDASGDAATGAGASAGTAPVEQARVASAAQGQSEAQTSAVVTKTADGAEASAGAGAGDGAEKPGEAVEGFKEASDAISAIARRASVKRGPKYVDPKTGVTWNGHGKAPHWIPRDKAERDAFLIKSTSEGLEQAPAGILTAQGAASGTVEGAAPDVPTGSDVEVTITGSDEQSSVLAGAGEGAREGGSEEPDGRDDLLLGHPPAENVTLQGAASGTVEGAAPDVPTGSDVEVTITGSDEQSSVLAGASEGAREGGSDQPDGQDNLLLGEAKREEGTVALEIVDVAPGTPTADEVGAETAS